MSQQPNTVTKTTTKRNMFNQIRQQILLTAGSRTITSQVITTRGNSPTKISHTKPIRLKTRMALRVCNPDPETLKIWSIKQARGIKTSTSSNRSKGQCRALNTLTRMAQALINKKHKMQKLQPPPTTNNNRRVLTNTITKSDY